MRKFQADAHVVRVVEEDADVPKVLEWLGNSENKVIALDLETTGLVPRHSRVRIIALSSPGETYLLDCFRCKPDPLFPVLREKTLLGHNIEFDLRFLLHHYGFMARHVNCSFVMETVLQSGVYESPRSLAALSERYMGVKREGKAEFQRGDAWEQDELTREHFLYAAEDTIFLHWLHPKVWSAIADAGLKPTVQIENALVPPLALMTERGFPLDAEHWTALAEANERAYKQLAHEMDWMAPLNVKEGQGILFDLEEEPEIHPTWDWGSNKKVIEVFGRMGIDLEDTKDATLAAVDHDVARALRRFREHRKAATSYGVKWLDKFCLNGRVYPSWTQILRTGRMSCTNPPMQTIPTPWGFRDCFRAEEGRVLAKCDLSQIELRIAAKITGDPVMRDVYSRGGDIHRTTAAAILHKSEADVTKADRNRAKPINFGLVYGMGPTTLQKSALGQYDVFIEIPDCMAYKEAYRALYPGVARWQDRIARDKPRETRTIIGRRRMIPQDEGNEPDPMGGWLKRGKSYFSTRLNTPIQASGADMLQLAMVHLYRDLLGGRIPASSFPVGMIHDELLFECDEDDGEALAAHMRQRMIEASAPMIDPIPSDAESQCWRSWGGPRPE